MKYKIGTVIRFLDKGKTINDFHESYTIAAYAITKDKRTVYLIWSSFNEYGNQYDFKSEEELEKEIQDNKECGYTVKIKEK